MLLHIIYKVTENNKHSYLSHELCGVNFIRVKQKVVFKEEIIGHRGSIRRLVYKAENKQVCPPSGGSTKLSSFPCPAFPGWEEKALVSRKLLLNHVQPSLNFLHGHRLRYAIRNISQFGSHIWNGIMHNNLRT